MVKSDGYFWLKATKTCVKFYKALKPKLLFKSFRLKYFIFISCIFIFEKGDFQKMNSQYDTWMNGSYVNLTSISED